MQLLDVVTATSKGVSIIINFLLEGNDSEEVFLVFEYLDHDLAGLMSNQSVRFEVSSKQIWQSVAEINSNAWLTQMSTRIGVYKENI